MSKIDARRDASSTPRRAGRRGGEAQAAAQPLRARVPAHQRANAGAVDRGHAAHVDDEMPLAAAEQQLDVLLERLGGAAGDERHLRREHEHGRVGSSIQNGTL